MGGECHDLPEGATCTEANQCASFPRQNSEDDDFVAGLFCGDSPIDPTIADTRTAYSYNPLASIEDGPSLVVPKDQRIAIAESYGISAPSDWDPSKLMKKCTKVLLPGEPCCNPDGGGCEDWKCGAPGASWGYGWPFQGTANGKCASWNTHLDPERYANSDGTPNKRYATLLNHPPCPTHF